MCHGFSNFVLDIKVSGSHSKFTPKHADLFEWCVVMCGTKNIYVCLEEIELHTSNLLTIIDSIAKVIGRACMILS